MQSSVSAYTIIRKRPSKLNSTRLVVMLITINISFCLLSMPMSILQIVYYTYAKDLTFDSIQLANNDNKKFDNNSEYLLDLIDLFHAIAELLQFVNHGSNFILYSLSGKTFRNETKRFFRIKFKSLKKIFFHRNV